MEADFCILLQQLGLEKLLFDNTFKLFPIKSFYFKFLCFVGFFWLLCGVWFGGGWESVGLGGVLLFVLGVCFLGLVFFLFGFVGVFTFFYFKREVAREKGNLSKLFMCCLENGILSPLSAVLAGIHMCSHKSSTD